MINTNTNLHKARREKKNEFYTRLSDIEKELADYSLDSVKDKVVFCNCNDVNSNFVKYFIKYFKRLGIKKLIATGYNEGGRGSVMIYEGSVPITSELGGDGDFRSPECIEFLKESDVVITNPPFSLFRELIDLLISHNKKFLIMGRLTNSTFKNVDSYLLDGKLWWGHNCNKTLDFVVPDDYDYSYIDEDGNKIGRVPAIVWYTNLTTPKSKEKSPIILTKKYDPSDYPKYDNYDAIEVSRVENIPEDYFGIMGVPVSFFDKYCPDQFEIVDFNPHFFKFEEKGLPSPGQLSLASSGRKDPFSRVLIKRKI